MTWFVRLLNRNEIIIINFSGRCIRSIAFDKVGMCIVSKAFDISCRTIHISLSFSVASSSIWLSVLILLLVDWYGSAAVLNGDRISHFASLVVSQIVSILVNILRVCSIRVIGLV